MKKKTIQNLLIVLIAIMVGTGMNLGGAALAAAVMPRLYLDSLGTILTAALCGYIPGIIVGFFSNILKGFSDPSSIYYSILNVLIAVSAAYFSKKKMFRRFPHVLLPVAVFTIIGGGIGSVLTWFLGGGVPVNGVPFIEQLGTDILNDLWDKFLTVALAAGILLLLPKRVNQLCNVYGWRKDDPLTRSSVGIHSLNTRIILVVSAVTIVLAVVVSGISIKDYHDSMINEEVDFASDVTNFAASFVDPERVTEFIQKGEQAKGYLETEKNLQRIQKSSDSIEYVYVYRIEENGCRVVFDVDSGEEKGADPGEVIPFDESYQADIPAFLEGKPIEPRVTNETYGWLLTVYKPVYDSKGVCQCYMGVDISMPKFMEEECIFTTQLLSLFLGFYVLILSVTISLAKNLLIKPINRLAKAAGEFAYNSEGAREDTVERIRAMDIHTGDEIENLYHAMTKTVEDTAAYISEVSEKNNAINKLQNGLIVVMADLVESRDKCTGDHIKNTAAYVEIILNKLVEEGIYSDQITEDFKEEVINSAPLHDIGKIKVPDAILNKPGRLTDEEFTIMRQHAAYGGEIIEDAMQRLHAGESDYLREARDLAHFHHEKWDGSGYPNGLKGEEIPLSARIMAVADVFDALISRRSYKEGMPFEKAMSIIREGSGSHFDPLIAQAFMDAEEEVRKVSSEKARL